MFLWLCVAAAQDLRAARCTASEYWNSLELECAACAGMALDVATASVLVADYASVDSNGNALDCRCPVGYVASSELREDYCSSNCGTLVCEACAETSYGDNSGCAACGNTTLGVDETGDCGCPDGQVLVETDFGTALTAKHCAECTAGRFVALEDGYVAGAYYEGNRYLCQACPDSRMNFTDGTCVCGAGYATVGEPSVGAQSCVRSEALVEYSASVRFDAVQDKAKESKRSSVTIESAVFAHYLANASALCSTFDGSGENEAACQTLANLCVLTNYDMRSSACALYEELRADRAARNAFGAVEDLPWLFYDINGEDVRGDTAIDMSMTLRASDESGEHVLDLRLATFTLNGTLLGFERLSTQMYYGEMSAPDTHKGGGPWRSTTWQRFGYSFRDHFRVDLSKLAERRLEDQRLYELFVVDVKSQQWYPVPVQNNRFTTETGDLVNRNEKTSDEDDDRFARRFTLFDVASGVPLNDEDPTLIRYLVKIKFHCEARASKPSRIHVPYLELDYDERRLDAVQNDKDMREARVVFRVEYWMDSSHLWAAVDALFFTTLAASVVAWIYARRIWQVKTYGTASGLQDGLTRHYAWRCLLLYARIFVAFFFPVVFLVASYVFVFFKLQETVFILLPRDDGGDGNDLAYYPFYTVLVTMWVAQTISVLQLVYDQCANDVFFLDWESPRATDDDAPQVSVWRTLFIANEWNELQTERRASLTLTLLGLGLVLLGFGFEHHATPQPHLDDRDPGHHNMVLRFANTTWWFVIFTLAQLAWKHAIYERYVAEPKAQAFVDMCTMAKIAVFVLDHEYHGWYIHGDSPYPHADDTMAELKRHLGNEANSESVGRGLDPRLPDLQTFRLWLTPAFRAAWDQIRAADDPQQEHRQLPQRDLHTAPTILDTLLAHRAQSSSAVDPRALDLLGAFLRTFFLHGYKQKFNLDWLLRLPSLAETLACQPPPLADLAGPVVLEPDRQALGAGWTHVIFLGHESDLLLHEILTFACADLWFRNAALSMLLTFLLHHAVRLLRAIAGEQNIAERASIDRRFLL